MMAVVFYDVKLLRLDVKLRELVLCSSNVVL